MSDPVPLLEQYVPLLEQYRLRQLAAMVGHLLARRTIVEWASVSCHDDDGLPLGAPFVLCSHERQVTPEGRYTYWRCLACGAEGKVEHPEAGVDIS